jgi:hypothetical protein
MREFKRLTCATDCLEHNDAMKVVVRGRESMAFAIQSDVLERGKRGRRLNTKDGKDGNTPVLCDAMINA